MLRATPIGMKLTAYVDDFLRDISDIGNSNIVACRSKGCARRNYSFREHMEKRYGVRLIDHIRNQTLQFLTTEQRRTTLGRGDMDGLACKGEARQLGKDIVVFHIHSLTF